MSPRPRPAPVAREVAPTVEALLGPAARREPLEHVDGKSGARLERVVVDGERFVLKCLHPADDWLMRATGDREGRPVALWRSGLLDRLPPEIDHAVVGAAWDDRPEGRGAVLLMRDVGAWLLPDGDDAIPLADHLAFLDHMAGLHAALWGWRDTVGLLPLAERFTWFGPRLGARERARGGADVVPTTLVPEGWARLRSRAPRAAEVVGALLDDPGPLVAALEATPTTFVHGDWKAGNLGRRPDGRTVLLDWAIPGAAPPCVDVVHYVCLNRARLPHGKDEALASYREALERHGVDTAPWWERQLTLCLLGQLMLFGWEKALGEGPEADEDLAWWQAGALAGAASL